MSVVLPAAEGSLLTAAAGAPLISLADLAPGDGVLILSPHPDDESLGCGAAIAAAAAAGKSVALIQLTDGEGSHPGSQHFGPQGRVAIRARELRDALAILAPEQSVPLLHIGLPDGCSAPAMLSPAMHREMRDFAMKMGAGSIWSTWGGDPHCDHETAAAAAAQLAAELDLPHWSFPVWGRFGSRSVPEGLRRFDAGAFGARKAEAIRCHRSQLDGAIMDDPQGFQLPPDLAEHFAQHPEIFIRER